MTDNDSMFPWCLIVFNMEYCYFHITEFYMCYVIAINFVFAHKSVIQIFTKLDNVQTLFGIFRLQLLIGLTHLGVKEIMIIKVKISFKKSQFRIKMSLLKTHACLIP